MEMPDLPETPTSDIPTGANNQPWDCTTTGVEMVEKQSRLPTTENRQYLHIKVEYAMRFPQLSAQIRRKGKTYQMSLKQTVMSGLIRVDEIARNYRWYYKAEVAFDMRTTPPRPFLSSTLLEKDGAGRRHTTNPFPVPGRGIYRRPDVIIVKNKEDRWPGLAGPDTEGNMHSDNLARLVEVKFPGDRLYEDQYEEYMQIVGRNRTRMTIVARGEPEVLEQIEKQLAKLVDVVDIKMLPLDESVCRELILIKVGVTAEERQQVIAIADIFRARIVDVAFDSVMIELTGEQQKLEAFINLLDKFHIKELARTGITGLARGCAD